MGVAEALIQTALVGEAVDAGPALIFVADEEMKYLAANRCACETLGYTRDELLKLRVTDVAREPDSPSEYDQMLVRGGRDGIALLTRKDGSTLPFTYRATRTSVAGLRLWVSVGFVLDAER
jgi:PAS domain S-box-containing protein